MNKLFKIAIVTSIISATKLNAKFDRNHNEELTDEQGENELDRPKDVPTNKGVIVLLIAGFIIRFVDYQKNFKTKNNNTTK